MIMLGNSPKGWTEIEGISCNGLYFVLCYRGDDEMRIFWYRSTQKFPRWFRSWNIHSLITAKSFMKMIRDDLHKTGNANSFIEQASYRRRGRIQVLNAGRKERHAEYRAQRALKNLPTFGMF